jgi:hypothetical protein
MGQALREILRQAQDERKLCVIQTANPAQAEPVEARALTGELGA